MKFFLRYMCGFAFGSLYAIINLVLISPLMRNHPIGIILWGIQGLVFILIWDLIGLIPIKFMKGTRLYFAIRGGISGFGASSLSVFITLLGTHADNITDSAIWEKLYSDLMLYASGVIALGVIVGLILRTSNRNRVRPD